MAAALAYSGWWVTGGIIWLLERRDPFVRRHAAQALTVFGLIALLIVACCALAVASLSFMPAAFAFFVVAAGVIWLTGVLLWIFAMWKAINGDEWRILLVDRLVDRVEGSGAPVHPST